MFGSNMVWSALGQAQQVNQENLKNLAEVQRKACGIYNQEDLKKEQIKLIGSKSTKNEEK